MSVQDAMPLRRRSIYHSSHRGGASERVVNLYYSQKDGWVKTSSEFMIVVHRKHVVERKTEDDASDASKSATSETVMA